MPRKQKDLTVNLAMIANIRQLRQAMNQSARYIGEFSDSSNRSLSGAARTATLFSATFVAALAAIGTRVTNTADQIAKSAKAIGFAADEYQRLLFAVERVGGDLTAIERGILRFQKQLAGVSDTEGVKIFERLGLSVAEFRKLSPEESFSRIAVELAKVEDQTTRNALVMELFGTRGSKAINLLINDFESFRKEQERAQKIGAVFSDTTLKNAQITKDAFGDIAAVVSRGTADGIFGDAVQRSEEWNIVLRDLGNVVEHLAEETIGKMITAINDLVGFYVRWRDAILDVRYALSQLPVTGFLFGEQDLAQALRDAREEYVSAYDDLEKAVEDGVKGSELSLFEDIKDQALKELGRATGNLQERMRELREEIKDTEDEIQSLGRTDFLFDRGPKIDLLTERVALLNTELQGLEDATVVTITIDKDSERAIHDEFLEIAKRLREDFEKETAGVFDPAVKRLNEIREIFAKGGVDFEVDIRVDQFALARIEAEKLRDSTVAAREAAIKNLEAVRNQIDALRTQNDLYGASRREQAHQNLLKKAGLNLSMRELTVLQKQLDIELDIAQANRADLLENQIRDRIALIGLQGRQLEQAKLLQELAEQELTREQEIRLVGLHNLEQDLLEIQAQIEERARQIESIWDGMVGNMRSSFETLIYDTLWEEGIDSFRDFGNAMVDTWKRALAQMVALWASSGITRLLQGGGVAGGLFGGVGSALASNGGGGVLSGLLGNFGGGGSGGGILQGLGSSFRSLGGLFGAGGGALAGFYSGAGATAAIGGSALGGATGAATAGGLAGSIGAALPAIGAVALAFSFFSSKTKELDNGIRITIDNMDVLAESYRRVQKSRFFGLSKKTREYYDEASDEITALFQEGIDTVRDSVGGVFNIFGLATESLDDFSAQFKVSLKDLSDGDRTKAIEDALRDIANQMTSAAFSANGLNLTLEESEAAMERLALAGELVVAAAERADAINEGRLDGLGAFQSQIENLTTQGLSDVLDEVSLELDTELSNEFERFVRDINEYLGTDSDNQITNLQQAADEIANRIEDAKRDLEREREAVLKITDDIERGAREFQVSQNEAALQGLRNLFDEVTTQLESIGGREFETLTTLSQAISDEFDKRGQQRIETSLITRLLDRADVVVEGINDLAAAASEATNQAFDFITGLINSAGGHVSQQTETLTNALITSIERYISAVTSASHLVNNYGSGIVDDLANDVKNARQALSDAVPSVTQSIVETVNEVVQQVRDTSDRGGDGPSGGVGGPGFATGGIVPGARGEPMLAVVHGGEEILTPMQRGQRDEPINITINVQGDADTMVVRAIERHVRDVASMIGSVR